MSDSQYTRIVRLESLMPREDADNGNTRVDRSRSLRRVTFHDYAPLFEENHRRMHRELSAQPAPGVMVFAIAGDARWAGQLWLSATDALRAGTIGRHSAVDLFLDGDEELSLRHLLVLARREGNRTRVRVLDLATPGGFQAETGGVLRAVDADGPFVLRASTFSLFFFPTGAGPQWNPGAASPWSTVPPRTVKAEERPAAPVRRSREVRQRSLGENTVVHFLQGPIEPGLALEPLLGEGEAAEGALVLQTTSGVSQFGVGARALERGVLLGRYSRCATATADLDSLVSRVHAAMFRVDGQVFLLDTGSTNGVTLDGRPVKCAPMQVGAEYRLGERLRVKWEIVH